MYAEKLIIKGHRSSDFLICITYRYLVHEIKLGGGGGHAYSQLNRVLYRSIKVSCKKPDYKLVVGLLTFTTSCGYSRLRCGDAYIRPLWKPRSFV